MTLLLGLLAAACTKQPEPAPPATSATPPMAKPSPPPTVAPPAAPVPPAIPARATELARAADAALDEVRKLDYRRPFLEPTFDWRPIGMLFIEACEAGDPRSCRIADAVYPRLGDRAMNMIRKNCLAGDQLSCRALSPEDPVPDKRFPGWANRMYIQDFAPYREQLQIECDAGFPVACRLLAKKDLDTRVRELSAVGCRGAVFEECKTMAGFQDWAAQREADDQLCRYQRVNCHSLVYDDPIAKRDAMEYGCQFSRANQLPCSHLESAYHAKLFPEPAPGRRRALERWLKEQKRLTEQMMKRPKRKR